MAKLHKRQVPGRDIHRHFNLAPARSHTKPSSNLQSAPAIWLERNFFFPLFLKPSIYVTHDRYDEQFSFQVHSGRAVAQVSLPHNSNMAKLPLALLALLAGLAPALSFLPLRATRRHAPRPPRAPARWLAPSRMARAAGAAAATASATAPGVVVDAGASSGGALRTTKPEDDPPPRGVGAAASADGGSDNAVVSANGGSGNAAAIATLLNEARWSSDCVRARTDDLLLANEEAVGSAKRFAP
jgi:hypothetical protein